VSAWGSKSKSVRQDEVKWESAQKYSGGKLSEGKNAVERRTEERTPGTSLQGCDEVQGGSPGDPPQIGSGKQKRPRQEEQEVVGEAWTGGTLR
jgi:hypothetical protein